ncbi:MAG: AbgT family transporter, partial [Pseudomonadales bacterium]|nr:AbgT family transporter [Pseudomonadales bacterium]
KEQQVAIQAELSNQQLTEQENKGLKAAGLAALLFFIGLAFTVVPANGILLNPDTGKLAGSPFLQSIVAFIFLFFALTGIVYGRVVGTMRNNNAVVEAMPYSMTTMSAFLVLVFFAAQFVAYFKWTNLGAISAVLGAEFLQGLGLTGPLLFGCFILICALINLMLGSASAQWAITAPIFVPMLMLVGYSPEVIQAAYRIGDSATNMITPMMSYFGLIIAVADKYRHNIGIGTMIAMMLPYSVAFLCLWTLFFIVWVFLFQIPVGPGAALFFSH